PCGVLRIGVSRPGCGCDDRPPRGERARRAGQDAGQVWAVAEDDAGHAVVGDPVHAERRVDLRAEVDGEEAVALQPPRGHQDEYAEGGVGEPETLRGSLREEA